MHRLDEESRALANEVVRYAMDRIAMQPPPLDGPRPLEELRSLYGPSITEEGLGGHEVLRRFVEGYAPATLSTDHPRFLSFVPVAPTKASVLFDLVVSASSICGTSWLEAAGVIFCENEALGWLASLAGFPSTAGGTFVSGGSAANLSGIHTGRMKIARDRGDRPVRWRLLCTEEAHSSVVTATSIMDIEVVTVKGDERGRLTGARLEETFESLDPETRSSIFGVVATAGTTNAGIVDDLRSSGEFARRHGLWFHVDGAYGGAALATDARRHLFDGIELADSFVVDPHKWLFAPYDSAALLYRDPQHAIGAHTQEASYLDDINTTAEWNPSSYAYQLSRRVRGLPFWFSLAVHGTNQYASAVQRGIELAEWSAREIERRDYVELVIEPELSVVLFRRKGWGSKEYEQWSERALRDQIGFVLPTAYRGERMLRFCFVNPLTTEGDISAILDSMAWGA
jgi:glutamate/tyrosine decarboxylase-like PLP-dependent enzyme